MNKVLSSGVVVLATFAICTISIQPSVVAFKAEDGSRIRSAAAPLVIIGDNIYVSWWTNKSGNDEVMFRSSSDAGKTFSDKINLSNSTNADSQDVEISADGTKVAVTWWERSQTINEPVMKVSNDGGKTFGPLIKLSDNGTTGSG